MARKNAIHTFFFEQWGTPLQDLEKTPESPATTAYGASLIDMGLQGMFNFVCNSQSRKLESCPGDTTVLVMAVAACLLGYGEVCGYVVEKGGPETEFLGPVGRQPIPRVDQGIFRRAISEGGYQRPQ